MYLESSRKLEKDFKCCDNYTLTQKMYIIVNININIDIIIITNININN